jgi:FtsP/CotA-like multicopper oxidase with cupredoxin domain
MFSFLLFGCGGSSSNTLPLENKKPTAIISPLSNTTINVDDSLIFSAEQSTDADGNTPLTYLWSFSGAQTSITTSNAKITSPIHFLAQGIVTVNLTVFDSMGLASDVATVTIQVNSLASNMMPTGFISHDNGMNQFGSTADINIAKGTQVIFNSEITDPDNDSLTYTWHFQGADPTSYNGAGPINVMYPSVGSFQAYVDVDDGHGNVVSFPTTPIMVNVTENVALPAFKALPIISPTVINGVATYQLDVVENVNVEIDSPSGKWVTPMMRYNNLSLPPVIVANRGDEIDVTVNNKLTQSNEATTVHWHGFKIPGIQDGGPDFPISVNNSKSYHFTIQQPAAPLWFHPHADGTTATQVYKGLAGAFIVHDEISDALITTKQLPPPENDIALLIQDREFAADVNSNGIRQLVYDNNSISGMLGDTILVNNVEMPALSVATQQYRFRLFNGSNARTYDFALDNGQSFMVIGTDGGLLNVPVLTDHIMLSAGERAEIVIDFAGLLQQHITLLSRSFDVGVGGAGMGDLNTLPNGAQFNVMRFDVNTQASDSVTLYQQLPNNADINSRLTSSLADTSRRFIMSMEMGGGFNGGMRFTINGKLFDINRIDETIASGATEIWEISNNSQIAHPFHAHAIQWQILDKGPLGGTLIPATGVDLGWKDTVLVQPDETVRIIGKFDPTINVGKYMYHCHILEHEDNGMMGTFEVLP